MARVRYLVLLTLFFSFSCSGFIIFGHTQNFWVKKPSEVHYSKNKKLSEQLHTLEVQWFEVVQNKANKKMHIKSVIVF